MIEDSASCHRAKLAIDRGLVARFVTIGLMCMAQTLPLYFAGTAVPAIFRKAGLPLDQFWAFSIPLAAYWLKFLWAPFVDGTGSARFGYRKPWILGCTMAGSASLILLSFLAPSFELFWPIIAVLTLHALFMSTQDVAVDAYTIENLRPHERPAGAGTKVLFEAAGTFTALAGLMTSYEQLGWRTALVGCAGLLFLLTLPALLRPELRDRSAATEILVRPSLMRFVRRQGSAIIVPLLIAGGIANAATIAMASSFFVDKGLSLTEIGLVTGSVYSLANVGGALLASALVTWFGASRAAILIACAALPAYLPYLALAFDFVPSLWLAGLAVLLPELVIAQLHMIFTVSRMEWASVEQAGTDFALQGTCYNLGRTVATASAGFIALNLGWGGFFGVVALIVGCVAAAIAFAITRLRHSDSPLSSSQTGQTK